MNLVELKVQMLRKGFTISSLAKEMGVSKKRLYSRFNGTHDFTQEEIQLISDLLNLNGTQIIKIFFTSKVS